jgi:hypothetical protein
MSKVAKKTSPAKDNLSQLRELTKELASTEIEHNSDAINEIKKLVSALAERVKSSTRENINYNNLELVLNKKQ